jgi:hypothetical protein
MFLEANSPLTAHFLRSIYSASIPLLNNQHNHQHYGVRHEKDLPEVADI